MLREHFHPIMHDAHAWEEEQREQSRRDAHAFMREQRRMWITNDYFKKCCVKQLADLNYDDCGFDEFSFYNGCNGL